MQRASSSTNEVRQVDVVGNSTARHAGKACGQQQHQQLQSSQHQLSQEAGSQQQQQQQDKWTCPCGGSCSDELSRLESRLALMESRLADFESLFRSCRSLSQSGDAQWPELSMSTGTAAAIGSGDLPRSVCLPRQVLTEAVEAPIMAETVEVAAGTIFSTTSSSSLEDPIARVDLPESAVVAAPDATGSQCDCTALNLRFTEDRSSLSGGCGGSSSSMTWTDLEFKPDPKACEDLQLLYAPKRLSPQSPPNRQRQECQEEVASHCSAAEGTESFDLVRYSTQETFVHQQQHDLATYSKDFLDDQISSTPPRGCIRWQQLQQQHHQKQQKSCMHHASNSMLTTEMSCAERLVTPAGECGATRSVLEPGAPREMADPTVSLGVIRRRSTQTAAAAEAGSDLVDDFRAPSVLFCPTHIGGEELDNPEGGPTTSCETATADCAVDVVIRSHVSRVRKNVNVDFFSSVLPPVAMRSAAAASTAADNANGGEDRGTVSTGEQTTATASAAAAAAAAAAAFGRSVRRIGGGGQSSTLHFSSSSSGNISGRSCSSSSKSSRSARSGCSNRSKGCGGVRTRGCSTRVFKGDGLSAVVVHRDPEADNDAIEAAATADATVAAAASATAVENAANAAVNAFTDAPFDAADFISPDCRLCGDLVPYTRRRLRDLRRHHSGRRRRQGCDGCDGGGPEVCIQRSGFSKLDTVLIAGLVLKAAALHEAEGDQASFVRLTLRKMGFECAVVIGRHFTGCICGLESSRLLLDFGERSCLIFSFFQLTTGLSQMLNGSE